MDVTNTAYKDTGMRSNIFYAIGISVTMIDSLAEENGYYLAEVVASRKRVFFKQ